MTNNVTLNYYNYFLSKATKPKKKVILTTKFEKMVGLTLF